MKRWAWGFLLIAGHVWAADWQFLGASDAGTYYADRHSLKWQDKSPVFAIATNVIEKDKAEWRTVIQIDCANSTFTYLSGAKIENGKASLRFDTARSTEKILTGTMPDLLKTEYCGARATAGSAPDNNIVRWEPAGKSSVANVYFDRASLKQGNDGFVIDTKVVPFNHEEETYATVSFSCKERTFTMLKLDRYRNGKLEKVFDKPQPPLQTSKMATLEIVANKFCGSSNSVTAASAQEVCMRELSRLRTLENRIQQDANDGELTCSQVESYLKQIAEIGTSSRQHDCAINGLTAYAQQIKSVGCVK